MTKLIGVTSLIVTYQMITHIKIDRNIDIGQSIIIYPRDSLILIFQVDRLKQLFNLGILFSQGGITVGRSWYV